MSLRVVVIIGPTAVGKTRLGVEVAHALESEILSADSRQVYRGLDLGTGKDLDEYAAVDPPVPYHLIDVADPHEVYTLYRYQQDCYRVLRRLADDPRFGSGSVPLLMVGGSGLYVEAVVRDYRITDVPVDADLRRRLEHLPAASLADRLRTADADVAARTDTTSRRRLIRGLEIAAAAARGPVRTSEPPGLDIAWRCYGLTDDRAVVRRRIRSRLEARLDGGLIDEVQNLLDAGLPRARLQALGLEYREIAEYLAGNKNRRRMVEDLAAAIGRFAKRQETWFRGMERRGTPVSWIAPGDAGRILDDVAQWVAG
ncbi:MAG: tRNA (adenosine(37)-N6)-dimethylallyltransferase MiaA [Thermoanaerobaculales bacterium]|jgi:tRNA dimethylallyltransferase|nr:tRNA (adenosine(37)-N6)-dimethylallyltransferase MiaA [Thermoanaerobaculales bacterium]